MPYVKIMRDVKPERCDGEDADNGAWAAKSSEEPVGMESPGLGTEGSASTP
jgi:hypothetical protein